MQQQNACLQLFYFKEIALLIVTNIYPHIKGRSETALCTVCNASVETVDNLFWTCTLNQDFIQNVKSEQNQYKIHLLFKQATRLEISLPSLLS